MKFHINKILLFLIAPLIIVAIFMPTNSFAATKYWIGAGGGNFTLVILKNYYLKFYL